MPPAFVMRLSVYYLHHHTGSVRFSCGHGVTSSCIHVTAITYDKLLISQQRVGILSSLCLLCVQGIIWKECVYLLCLDYLLIVSVIIWLIAVSPKCPVSHLCKDEMKFVISYERDDWLHLFLHFVSLHCFVCRTRDHRTTLAHPHHWQTSCNILCHTVKTRKKGNVVCPLNHRTV